jgi:hypothetical protein
VWPAGPVLAPEGPQHGGEFEAPGCHVGGGGHDAVRRAEERRPGAGDLGDRAAGAGEVVVVARGPRSSRGRCRQPWTPISWPAAAISRTTPGERWASLPSRTKVARTPRSSSRRRKKGLDSCPSWELPYKEQTQPAKHRPEHQGLSSPPTHQSRTTPSARSARRPAPTPVPVPYRRADAEKLVGVAHHSMRCTSSVAQPQSHRVPGHGPRGARTNHRPAPAPSTVDYPATRTYTQRKRNPALGRSVRLTVSSTFHPAPRRGADQGPLPGVRWRRRFARPRGPGAVGAGYDVFRPTGLRRTQGLQPLDVVAAGLAGRGGRNWLRAMATALRMNIAAMKAVIRPTSMAA